MEYLEALKHPLGHLQEVLSCLHLLQHPLTVNFLSKQKMLYQVKTQQCNGDATINWQASKVSEALSGVNNEDRRWYLRPYFSSADSVLHDVGVVKC